MKIQYIIAMVLVVLVGGFFLVKVDSEGSRITVTQSPQDNTFGEGSTTF